SRIRDHAACAEGFGPDAVCSPRAGEEAFAETQGAPRRIACGQWPGHLHLPCGTNKKARESFIREPYPDENDKSDKCEGAAGDRRAALREDGHAIPWLDGHGCVGSRACDGVRRTGV